jgi:hypothetical protein
MGFILASVLSGCGDKLVALDRGAGLTPQSYAPAPVYDGPTNSVGTLTEGYIQNTTSLANANSRLDTLCVAYHVCLPTEKTE